MAVSWRQFVMDLENFNPDEIEAVFTRHGAQSVTLSDAGDNPVLEPAPGETPLWARTRIAGLFPHSADFTSLERDLLQSLDTSVLPEHDVVAVEDRAWEREWLKDFGAMQFGDRLWICPGDTVANAADAVVVHLDPGLAFGTGTHATTAMCLTWLDGIDLRGKTMLDYGSGSGVLAIAGLLLGCRTATAMDIDEQAVIASRENSERNGVADRLTVLGDPDSIDGTFDVVVANILAGPLVELAASIAARVSDGCLLALSGILSGQVDEVRCAYEPWIRFDEPVTSEQGGQCWALLTGRRIGG